MTVTHVPWWKDGVVYQIYPASFKDSNGDGIGDIRGITKSLDYIKALGANIIWVCPMYDSPQIDMGYDISDYKNVYPPYGTVQDMEDLFREAHALSMRVILDLVINHTSDQHEWFKASRSSKDDPRRNWYIWKPAKYDAEGNRKPPNNWRSNFGGSAWEWDESTQEYYLHLFCKEQPDLNWESEEARKAIYDDSMIFWLERGVDGFRVDTVNMYSKDPSYPDAPITDHTAEWQEAGKVYCNGPRMHEFLSEMNSILTKYDAMSVGECPHTPDMKKVIQYVSAKENQLDMVFQFDVVDIGMGRVFKYQTDPRTWRLPELKAAIERTQTLITGTDAWTTAFMENHDQARCISRFGDDSPKWRVRSGKMLALLLAALSGTLYIYQGQEIGMINLPKDCPIEEYKDVDTINYYNMIRERSNNDETELARAHAALQHLARDHARTPMQWTSAINAGFSSDDAKPWMRVNPSKDEINVAQQAGDKSSVLAFWRQMLQLRQTHNKLLVHGDFELLDKDDENVITFVKKSQGQKALVVCNFTGREQRMPQILANWKLDLLVGNVDGHGGALAPWEARIYTVR